MPIITQEYLEWVIKEYGEEQEITQTNCNNNPIRPNDYVIKYGAASALLKRIKNGEKLYWC